MRYTTLVLATVVKMRHYKQLVVYCMNTDTWNSEAHIHEELCNMIWKTEVL